MTACGAREGMKSVSPGLWRTILTFSPYHCRPDSWGRTCWNQARGDTSASVSEQAGSQVKGWNSVSGGRTAQTLWPESKVFQELANAGSRWSSVPVLGPESRVHW